MNYPDHLLPATNYKIIEWSDDLLPLFLIRHTTPDLFLPGTDKINPDTIDIPTEHLSDLSTNLLGVSKIDDIYFKVTNSCFLEAWEEGCSVVAPSFDKDFQIESGRKYYYWKIRDIISCQIEPTEIISCERKHMYSIFMDIIHTPKKCNFWHFSIIAFTNDKINIGSLQIGLKQKKKLWRTAKINLVNIILTELELSMYSSLDSKHYMK